MPSPKRRNDDVACLTPFRDTNKFAVNSPDQRLYIVYSYGKHFPLFVFDKQTGTWYTNEDKYSVTTSKHRTQCLPYTVPSDEFQQRTTRWLVQFIDNAEAMEDVPC